MTNGFDMDAIATHEEDLDIDTLNDSQLYEKLKENNIVAGPIVDSTREIYKKKLHKVLYGVDEESFVSGGEAELVNDEEDEDEIVADEEEEEIIENGNLTGPIMEKEDEEEVVDGVNDSQYESKSETDDDQPCGVSRPVDVPSGLRKRTHGNDAESNEVTREYGTDPQPDAKSATSPLMSVMVFLAIAVAAVIAIYFLSVDMPDTVDSIEEAIEEAANKAATGTGAEEYFTKAANKAASGVEGEEDLTEAAKKAASGVEGEEVFTF